MTARRALAIACAFGLALACGGAPPLPQAAIDVPAASAASASGASEDLAPKAARARDVDNDGIPDDADLCPTAPEDCDGFQDGDGCPDPDNDADGVLDACDKCPNEPETYNGFEDEDGCPDRGKVIVVHDIQIIPLVLFAKNATRPLPEATAVIDAMAAVMKSHPELELVALVGGATSDEAKPDALSLARAQQTLAMIGQRGVDARRLEARGAGTKVARPGAPNDPQDRQVRAWVVRANGAEFARWNGSAAYDPIATPAPQPPPARPACTVTENPYPCRR